MKNDYAKEVMKKHKAADLAVKQWNQLYPAGQAVTVEKDNGETIHTTTRSEAWNLHGTAVILVVGISGCYRLDRVLPKTT